MWPLPFSGFILSSFFLRWVYFRPCWNYKNSRFGLIPVKWLEFLVLLSQEHTYNSRRTELFKKVFSFLRPSLQNKHRLRSWWDCCARSNLILGGGALKTSGEASRLCSQSSRGSVLDRSSRQLRSLKQFAFPYQQLQVHISPSPKSMLLRSSY